MAVALVFLAVIGFVLLLLWYASSVAAARKARLQRKLEVIAGHLGGGYESNRAWGEALGAKTTLEFTTRGAGSSSRNWTHITVEVPRAYPLAIHVRRHIGSDRRVVARGDMVDVLVGDPAFDEAFLVEAAPVDVVRQLLDEPVRAVLTAHRDADLETIEAPDGARSLQLGLPGWIEELEALRGSLATMARLGASVRSAFTAADHGTEALAAAASPYRPELDAQPARAAQAAREAEVDRIKAVRGKRAADLRTLSIIMVVLIGVLTLIGIAASSR